jgi:hypothetical protein
MMYACGRLFLRDVGDGLEYDGQKLAPTTQRKVAELRGGEAEKLIFFTTLTQLANRVVCLCTKF